MTNNEPIFYEQGTGSYGDASTLVFVPSPDADADAYQDDDAMWTHMNDADTAGNSVEFADIVEALRDARNLPGSDTEALDRILAILDPGDSVAFDPES